MASLYDINPNASLLEFYLALSSSLRAPWKKMASPASLSPANLEALRQLLPTLATNCTGTPTPSRSKSKSFWLEDGNVIIETPDLQFRVYRGLLSRHSSYFESVLASSEDAQGNFSTHCPTVFLWNDSASDWERVLRVLVNNDTYASLQAVLSPYSRQRRLIITPAQIHLYL